MAASIGAGLMLEQPDDNPFLERFYRSPAQYALQTQLYFLFQRVKQLTGLRQGDLFSPIHIADFMLEKDPLFARLTLDEDELYLVKRIRKRGILFERNMERDYLEELSEAYTRFFLGYHDSALLMVNAENINFLDNDEHYELLLEQIKSIQTGRHYFNPVI